MDRTSTATTWVFQNRSGAFDITKAGTGSQEFKLDGTGNLTILGALTQGSDRNTKTNIKDIDSGAVLAKLEGLPISSWAYKTDADSEHIGPMAQDFYAAFGLGHDDKHIAPADIASVAANTANDLIFMMSLVRVVSRKARARLPAQHARRPMILEART